MFKLDSVLTRQRCLCQVAAGSKKRIFETASGFICEDQPQLDAGDVYRSMLAREKLGSTALGEGTAIPHCRVGNCRAPVGALITLVDGIDFDAPDGAPVDILFMLLVPEEARQEHLNILAGLAQLLGNEAYRRSLREASSRENLYRAAVDFRV